jgi:xylulokinase
MIQPGLDYNNMNELAQKSPVGSKGVSVIPFGNGAERVLENKNPGCSFHGINFNIHTLSDIVRASQEGIVFSFRYGMEIMEEMGMEINVIRAGNANMFLSPVFRETLAGVTGATIELFDTDGAAGAAKAAGMGVGIYSSNEEAFASLKKIMTIGSDERDKERYEEAYQRWKTYITQ